MNRRCSLGRRASRLRSPATSLLTAVVTLVPADQHHGDAAAHQPARRERTPRERPLHQRDRPRCFAETGRCRRGRFLTPWPTWGGLPINGYPIRDEFVQVLEDGKPYMVQYFERVRLEYHPENAAPHDVLLRQFGRRIPGETTRR